MILRPVSQFKSRVMNYIDKRFVTNLYLIGGKQWAYYWDHYYLTIGLKQRLGKRVRSCGSPWDMGLKNQLIHFTARQHFLSDKSQALDPSNRVFLTWFHGSPSDEDAGIRRSFEKLLKKQDELSKIIVSCKTTEKNLIRSGVSAAKLVSIPIGVDLSIFKPTSNENRKVLREKFNLSPQDFCIGSFQKDGEGWGEGSSPKWVKGPDIFLQVLNRIHKKNPHIMVVLTGPARDYVKKGLKKSGIRYMHQELENYHDIVSYYHLLDAYLITSRSEGGPKGLMESWACGVPVVSTRVGMCADFIVSDVNGLMSEIDDVESLANQLITLIEDTQSSKRMAQSGLESVVQFDWDNIADQHHKKIYEPYL